MKKLKISDIKEKCKKAIEAGRTTSEQEEFGKSLNFYMDNGFFYEECRNLDVTLAALILPRLIHFRDICTGVPNDFVKYDKESQDMTKNVAKWKDVLDKMIFSFYTIVSEGTGSIESEEREEIQKKVDEGLELFGKYFQALWD